MTTGHEPARESDLQVSGSASTIREAVGSLSPACFALAMATGIVSLAAQMLALPVVAVALFVVNVAAYVVLALLTALRLAWFPRRLWSDLLDHDCGPGFFTFVAASTVLGSQFIVLEDGFAVATLLWIIALVAWVGLTYTVFTALTIKPRKPPLENGISGGWLLAVVAAQSIAVLSAYLTPHWRSYRLELDFLALAMWLSGGMLYTWTIVLIFYRFAFFPLLPTELSPSYWINMGAMAISTLAGSLLILRAADTPLLSSLRPFLAGCTVLYWATATWWIPLLATLFVWRHTHGRIPLRYDASWWSAVFPLGMYAACTFEMARALGLEFLDFVPRFFAYLALAAWVLAFVGLARSVARASIAPRQRDSRGRL